MNYLKPTSSEYASLAKTSYQKVKCMHKQRT